MSEIAVKQLGKVGCPGAMPAPYRKYDINKIAISVGTTQVPIGNNVNGFEVKNAGNTLVSFKGELLQPGESQTIGGNEGEIYAGRVDIFFVMPVPAPGTPVNMCFVTVKYYV